MVHFNSENLTLLISLYLFAINFLAFIFMATDKYYAKNKIFRIQEKTLLNLIKYGGLIGG